MPSTDVYAGHLFDDGRGVFVLRRFLWSTVLGGLKAPPSGRWWCLAMTIQMVMYLLPLAGLLIAHFVVKEVGEWQLCGVLAVWGVLFSLFIMMVSGIVNNRKVASSISGERIFWNDYVTEEVDNVTTAIKFGLTFDSTNSISYVRPVLIGLNFGLLAWASARGQPYFILSAIAVSTTGGFSTITGVAPVELAPVVSRNICDPSLSRSLTLLLLLLAACIAVITQQEVVASILYIVIAACPCLWAAGLLPKFEDACLWIVEFSAYYFCGTTNPVPVVPLAIVAVLAVVVSEAHLLVYASIGVLLGLIPPSFHCNPTAVLRQLTVCSIGIGLGWGLRQVADSSPTQWWIVLISGLVECSVLQLRRHLPWSVEGLAHLSLMTGLACFLIDTTVTDWGMAWLCIRHFAAATSGARGLPLGLSIAVTAALLLLWGDPDELPETAVLVLVADLGLMKVFAVVKGLYFGVALTYYSFRAPKQRHRGREVFACLSMVLLPLSCALSNDSIPLPLFTSPLFVFRPWLPSASSFLTRRSSAQKRGLQGLLCRALVIHGGLVEVTRRLFEDPQNGLLLFRAPEEGLLFVGNALKRWYGGYTVEFRFSELADQTSCHQAEARAVDAAFLGERRVWALENLKEKISIGYYEYSKLSMAGVISSEECLRAIWKSFGMVLLVMVKRLEDIIEGAMEDTMHGFETVARYFPQALSDHLGVIPPSPAIPRPGSYEDSGVVLGEDVEELLRDVLPGSVE